MKSPVNLSSIQAAAIRLANYLHFTPVLTSKTINSMSNKKLYFKAENLQKTGSFKARGALNASLSLMGNYADKPRLVTHSSGNHGTALAWAACTLGHPCTVVVPEGTPDVKCRAIRAYGADLVFCYQTPMDREVAVQKIIQEQGGVLIPPSDHHDVISGQGTLALELLEQVPDLNLVLVPISGGGMAAGVAVAVKAVRPKCKVLAVEPEGKCLENSLRARRRLWNNPPAYLITKAGNLVI